MNRAARRPNPTDLGRVMDRTMAWRGLARLSELWPLWQRKLTMFQYFKNIKRKQRTKEK